MRLGNHHIWSQMSVRIFTIPFDPEKGIFFDEDFSRFLLNKNVKNLKPEFFQLNGRAYWTVFVEYETVLNPEKAEDGLDESQRLLMKRLRQWRKEKGEQEGIPVFIIATNKQLVDIIHRAPNSLETLREVNGFGKKKVERHGKDVIEIIKAFYEKKPASFKKAKKAESNQTKTDPNIET